MTLVELIKNRRNTYSPEEDEQHNAPDFYKGYSKGWQDAYDDLLRILKGCDVDINSIIIDFRSSVR